MKTAKSKIVYTPPIEGSWDIPGVSYRGEKGTYRLFETMTPSLDQDELAQLYTTEKQKGNPHPTDMPLLWAIATQVYELRDENEALRDFLRKGLRKFSNTLTRIVYNTSGMDCVIHNYGTSDVYSKDSTIVGSDGWINELTDSHVLEEILGTQDTQKINNVSHYINGTASYLWRLNSRPKQKEERIARFDADDDWLEFNLQR